MEQLYVFGTGHAAVTRYYNTCFAIRDGEEYFMTDAGGGNGILRILEEMKVELKQVHHLFVTHKHTDHILGVVWIVRMIATAMAKGTYEGELNIYCHEELPETIRTLCRLTLLSSLYQMLGDRIHLIPVQDGEQREILGHQVTFFDIHSTKAKQFGFTMLLSDGSRLTCAGDEPYHPSCEKYVKGSGWLLHEAFCRYSDRDRFKPYEKHHSTVLDACRLAEELNIPNLVLWHTEDKHVGTRRQLYMEEGRPYYHGNLLIPEDRDIINLV